MAADHSYVQVAPDSSGKKIGNVQQTDPDGHVVQLQKTVSWDPEDETDAGAMRVTDGRAHTQQRAEVSDDVTATWDDGTAGGTTASVAVAGHSLALVSLVSDGSFDGGTASVWFEGSANGGADWGLIDTIQTWSIAAIVLQTLSDFDDGWASAYRIDCAGLTHVRVRLDGAIVAGALTVTLRATAGKAPYAIVNGTFNGTVGIANGGDQALGATTDAAATGDGTLIAIVKRLRTLLNGGLPAALGAGGGLKIDGSGTALPVSGTFWQATQPVSGTVSINAIPAGTNNIGDVDVLSLPSLPAGSNAIGKLAANSGVDIGDVDVTSVPADPFGANADAAVSAGATGSVSAKLRAISRDLGALLAQIPASLGQKAMAASLSVTVASDQSAVPTSAAQSGTWTVQPGNTANTTAWKVDGSAVTQPVSAASLPLPSGAATAAKQPALGTAGTPSSDVISVQGISGGTALPVKEQRAATATLSNVNDTASNTTLLASNANRLGATIHNDSTAVLYVKLGATASTTSFTVKMVADAYYEVPFNYTGQIDGIWASDASGAARVTELTA